MLLVWVESQLETSSVPVRARCGVLGGKGAGALPVGGARVVKFKTVQERFFAHMQWPWVTPTDSPVVAPLSNRRLGLQWR